YLDSQLAIFGQDKVTAHAQRPTMQAEGHGFAKRVSGAMFVTAAMWLLSLIEFGRIGWICGVIALVIFGLWCRNANLTYTDYNAAKLTDSSLIIGPAGMALAQADLTGELRWAELRDIRFKASKSQ